MKILVADDDPVTLEAVCACLREEGFIAVPAGDGVEAVETWRRERPSLLCLDLMMPRLDGFAVCRQVRAADGAVPILFLSAKNEEADVVAGLELGADDFIRKPFGRKELLARVRAALRRRGQPAATLPGKAQGSCETPAWRSAGHGRERSLPEPATAVSGRFEREIFRLRDLEVFPEELRAERGGTGIDLTPREVRLLRVLFENAGRPVPRDMFLDRCWGLDYFPESRTLDQHMVQLRRKIGPEPDPSRPVLIETVRGVGYRFRG